MATERKPDDEITNEGSAVGFNPFRDIVLAVVFLTRLPLPMIGQAPIPLARTVWAFPFAGVLTGGIGGGVFLGAIYLGVFPLIAIVLGLAASILVSGALHEDGLADVSDGFGGGATKERKLEIMHDSRIGAYGVLGILFSVLLRIVSLFVLMEISGAGTVFVTMIGSAAFSRGALPAVMRALPPARNDGLSKAAGRPGVLGAFMALALGVGCVVLLSYPLYQPAFIAMLVSAAAIALFCLVSMRQIGGQTGDVIGAAQQVCEVVFLVTLTVTLGEVA